MVLDRPDRSARPYALYAFLWALLLSAFIVVPVMIYDKGCFLYYGDFNVQEIPFYQLAHDSIRSGNVGWSHLTDLGANFIGSYSFYLLGSPFFWLTVPMPSSWVPYTIGPLLMLKLGCCSLSAYLYMRRYVRRRKFAVIGGVIYAFSSFSIYNIFFFHFHEAMIVFPLLLAALDEFHAAGRRGVVALAVFASAAVNYYFFVGQVVFVAIYYVVKLISKSYRFRLWDFISLAIECVIGFMLALFILLPSVAAILGNYRVSRIINGWDALLYSKPQRYAQIFVSLFFPGDVPAKNNFTASAGAKWSSVAAYLPMFSMTFVIACLRDNKRSFFRRMIMLLLIMAVIPAFNSAFQMLNSNYYARWFYMLTLLMTTVTVQSLDSLKEVDFRRGFLPTAVITVAVSLLIGLMPKKTDQDDSVSFGLEEYPTRFWAFVLIAVGGLLLTFIIYFIYQKKPRLFFRATALLLSLFVVGYSGIYIWSSRVFADRDDEFMLNYALNRGEDVTLADIKDVRSDFYETSDNLGMFWQVPTIQAFHSIVPGALIDFYNRTGVKRDVGSRPEVDYYGLRSFLSVKYLFVEEDEERTGAYTKLMPGFRYINTENGFDEYENEFYIPMGFTFDRFITEEEYSDISDSVRHLALLKAMVLSQDEMAHYADITGYTEGMYDKLNEAYDPSAPQNSYRPTYEGFESITADFDYAELHYRSDTAKLRANSCSKFAYTKEGFSAQFINTGEDNLLFFSVPYDDGWSAAVNGEPVEIVRASIGFMAVRVPGRTKSEIEFRYETPMLKTGCILSGAALLLLIFYIACNKGLRAQRSHRKTYRIKQKSNT